MYADYLFSHEGTKRRRKTKVGLSQLRAFLPSCEIFLGVLCLILLLGPVGQAAPADLWPAAIKVTDTEKQRAALDATPLPPELKPAVQFQKTFLKIIASKNPKAISTEELQELKTLIANDRESDPVAHGVAEIARAWIARTQMQQIDAVLRQYYRKNVRFPDSLAAIESTLPEPLRRDPWGQVWSYQPCAPAGLPKLAGQRYYLTPSKEAMGTVEEMIKGIRDYDPSPVDCGKITPLQIGGKRALEFHVDNDGPPRVYALQAGGSVTEHIQLLYIGDHWALLSWPDQLFAVTF